MYKEALLVKARTKKGFIIGIILIIATYVFIINPYAFNLYANVSNRQLADPAGMTYIEFFQNIADKYDININKVVGAKNKILRLYSDDISSLSDEKIFEFFTEFSSAEGDLIITDKAGQEHKPSLMNVYSKGHKYGAHISDAYYWGNGNSWLMRDGETIYRLYSSDKNSGYKSKLNMGNLCPQCGGDGRTHDWKDEGTYCWKCKGDGYIGPNDF